MKGHLITLEGIDGTGKSTISGILSQRLPLALPERQFVFTAEPSKGDSGKIIRVRLSQSYGLKNVARARKMEELFLFMADHADHLAETIIPSLEMEKIVISDRYADSTAAYQGVTLKGLIDDPMGKIREFCDPWSVKPDLTILFLLDPDLALDRLQSRAGMEKFEKLEFLKEVDKNFRQLAKLEPQRFALVNANRSLEEVSEEVINLILGLILGKA